MLRGTAVSAARNVVAPDAPTQILLRQIARGGPQTVHQIWEQVEPTGKFASKNTMKQSLDFLRRHRRIEVRPQDPANHKINYVYTLGEKPQMVEEDDASSQA